MNKKFLTAIALILCGAGLYLWWFSDAKVITRSTESLIECFEKDANDGRIGGTITTSTFRDLLDDRISFILERNDIPYASGFGATLAKGDLVQMHGGLVNSPAIVTITDKKIEIIEIIDDEAKTTLKFHIKTDKLPKNLDHSIHCDLTYKKVEGDWKVSAAVLK